MTSIQETPKEYLITTQASPLAAYPIKDKKVLEFIRKIQGCMWVLEDIELSADIEEFRKFPPEVQKWLTHTLAFFVSSDVLVNNNLSCNFQQEFDDFYYKMFYGYQYAQETVHTQTYTLLITSFIQDEAERFNLLNSVNTHPFVRKKALWAEKYMHRVISLEDRLIAFACVEGVFFSSSFCAIYWLKHQGKMPGLCASNEYIARDEHLHTAFSCYAHEQRPVHSTAIRQIVMDAVEIECEFVNDSLEVPLIGMNSNLMCQYVKFCADKLLCDLKQEPVYKVDNPFNWMTLISLDIKQDFFKRRPTSYQNIINTNLKQGKYDSDEEINF